jgi:CHAT domain-containing protein
VLATLPHHTVLHFACHGSADFDSPLDSGLLMANDETLSLRDFFNLDLQVRLATLSACETGLPGLTLPDEVVSLPTGLLQAGVAGVVASLWSVADSSTMLLMVKFYDLWRKQNLAPSEALRQAQIWLRDSPEGEFEALSVGLYTVTPEQRCFEHPFYWAAFSYTGS